MYFDILTGIKIPLMDIYERHRGNWDYLDLSTDSVKESELRRDNRLIGKVICDKIDKSKFKHYTKLDICTDRLMIYIWLKDTQTYSCGCDELMNPGKLVLTDDQMYELESLSRVLTGSEHTPRTYIVSYDQR